jgi:hypothetical protein
LVFVKFYQTLFLSLFSMFLIASLIVFSAKWLYLSVIAILL